MRFLTMQYKKNNSQLLMNEIWNIRKMSRQEQGNR